MLEKVPHVTFSLHPDKEALLVSSLRQDQIIDGDPEESTTSHLEMLNSQGLEQAAILLGKHILGFLRLSNPERFEMYPNLVFEIPKPPTDEELSKRHEKLHLRASEEGSDS
jgi:hypothetical protein